MSKLMSPAHIRAFIFAGNATFTLRSRKTGERFTYQFSKVPEKEGWWVRVLTGPDNESDYSFMGTIWGDQDPNLATVLPSRKSEITPDAASWRGLVWFLMALSRKNDLLDQVEVFHEGRCGRCGRKLTVPESVETGFGPECINHV